MKSVMTPQEQFARVANPKIQRSVFDRSHGYKTTFNAGDLIPIYVDEALPGDTINLNCTVFGRFNTLIKPIMDNVKLDVHFFSVPQRLVWSNWQRFMGEQDNPDDTTDYLMPTITSGVGGYAEGSIYDYLGLPTKIAGIEHRADFLRAINLIWNQWYRDENLQDSVVVNLDDGPDAPTDYTVLKRGKRKDYFTSCLPWAQKADPVSIPLGDYAPVLGIGKDNQTYPTNSISVHQSGGASNDATWTNAQFFNAAAADAVYLKQGDGTRSPSGYPDIWADLSEATVITINALREAAQIQVMYETDARGGTRYIELLKAHFGVTSPDARLQRPEFLGGYTTSLNVSPIAQNSNSDTGITPQGNLSALATFGSSQKGFTKSFVEHEIIIGFISARADLNYQQGLNRMWSRSTRFDFYWPSFAHLGEQAVLNKEIYAQGTSADDDVFGYQERYAEYRYKPSVVTGLFRSNATASLDVWHLAQEFSSLPALNDTFIVENPPIDRVVAVTTEPDFNLDCFFQIRHARPMPTYSTPSKMFSL